MFTPATLPAEARARLEPLLAPGEAVRWVGASDPDRLATAPGVGPIGDRIYIAFAASVMLGCVALAAFVRAIEPLIAAMIGAFLLARAWLSAGRNARERARIRERVHAVTDRRVISISGNAVWVVDARQLTSTGVLGSGDGWGDLTVCFRSPGVGPDDDEFELTLAGVPEIKTAVYAVERLIIERVFDVSDDAAEALRHDAAHAPQAA